MPDILTLSTPTPPRLRQGDSVSWTFTLSEFDGWTLTYRFAGLVGLDVPCVAAPGGAFTAALTASASAALAPGRYLWALVAVRDDERVTVADGATDVLADPLALAAGADVRSHARRVLDAIEAVIEGRATTDAQQLTIRSRTIAKTPIPDLLKLRDRYRAEVAREDAAAGLSPFKNKVYVRWAR